MRIAVIGAGGLGGYFGARLAQGGADVRFLARGSHLAAMRASGLVVEGGLDVIRVAPVRASEIPPISVWRTLCCWRSSCGTRRRSSNRSSRWSARAPL
ncbi:2-dehydropantoate 2-reductase N-terminal domain-containing protein [Bradyrhizobium cytisi]|uniref:ketopantoate reductase family protein n=1 Tax=Bradyrhizobium cytisi TaxID=515489 RepID=UPI001AEDA602